MLRQPGPGGRDAAHAGPLDPSGTHRVQRGQLHPLGSGELAPQVRAVRNDAIDPKIHAARHLLRVIYRPHRARTMTFSSPAEGGRGHQ
jgi:hypothetical protein